MRRLTFFLALFQLCSAQTNVLTYHNDNSRTGQNLTETQLTPASVKSTTFGLLYSFAVDGKVDAQPLVVSGLVISGSAHKVVFAATENDSIFAFDAATGAQYWHITLLKTGETTSDDRGCGQVTPEIGITSTPVIDLSAGAHGTLYAVAMSKDSTGAYHQRLHAIDLVTGAEQSGSPVDIQATYPGTGDNSSGGNVVFDPKQYKERTALIIVKGLVYTSWASHCDDRPYTGWTMAYDESTLAQKFVFNFTPNGNAGALWGAGGGVAADSTGNLYFSTGNGTFDDTLTTAGFPTGGDFGNSFVKLAPGTSGTSLQALDYWTMYNTNAESSSDEDLGSGNVILLPDVMDASGKIRHLGTGAGKDANVYVFDRDNMGKFDSANNSTLYQELPGGLSGGEFASPAWFNGSAYYCGVGDVIRSFPMTSALLASKPSSTSAVAFPYPGASPAISANGSTNAILWAVANTSPAILYAYDATNLATLLYDSNQAPANRDQFGAGNKYMTPTVANGQVFVGTPSSVAVFGLLPNSLPPTLTSILPASGRLGRTTDVILTGTNFAAGASLIFSGTGISVNDLTFVSDTRIKAQLSIAPNATTGVQNVSVKTAAGTSAALPFNVRPDLIP
jgi:hypothetical protein